MSTASQLKSRIVSFRKGSIALRRTFVACESGHFHTLKKFIKANRVDFRWEPAQTGLIPLIALILANYASQRSNELLILLEWIFSHVEPWVVNIRTSNDWTALNTAISCNSVDCVRLLLRNGANPATPTCDAFVLFINRTLKNVGMGLIEDIEPDVRQIFEMICSARSWWCCPKKWRPTLHLQFPRQARANMRCLLILYHSRAVDATLYNNVETQDPRYPQSALCMMPVEIFQYFMAWVCTPTWPFASCYKVQQ